MSKIIQGVVSVLVLLMVQGCSGNARTESESDHTFITDDGCFFYIDLGRDRFGFGNSQEAAFNMAKDSSICNRSGVNGIIEFGGSFEVVSRNYGDVKVEVSGIGGIDDIVSFKLGFKRFIGVGNLDASSPVIELRKQVDEVTQGAGLGKSKMANNLYYVNSEYFITASRRPW